MDPTKTLHLHLHLHNPSSSTTPAVLFPLPSLDSGVDLSALAAALNLDLATVRLNGHLLSRGSDGVSCVTWRSVLEFFRKKGLPTGVGSDGAVVVQGKKMKKLQLQTEFQHANNGFKRKCTTEDCRSKKQKSTQCHADSKLLIGDVNTFHLKTRLRLDEENSFKKRRTVDGAINSAIHSGSISIFAPKASLPETCINARRKRQREDDIFSSTRCEKL